MDRVDATARAVIECAADAIVAFDTDRTVLLWNPAAERMFGWTAAEVVGLEPPIIPEELKAEHNAVLERVRGGGQISFATRRIRKDGGVLDVRIDTSALVGAGGEVTGWVNVCHQAGEDDVARHYMAERARVVRRLGDVVADMNAQRDLESVLDRIAAEPARADRRRRRRFRAHRGRHAPAGQLLGAAGPAARADRDAVHEPGR